MTRAMNIAPISIPLVSAASAVDALTSQVSFAALMDAPTAPQTPAAFPIPMTPGAALRAARRGVDEVAETEIELPLLALLAPQAPTSARPLAAFAPAMPVNEGGQPSPQTAGQAPTPDGSDKPSARVIDGGDLQSVTGMVPFAASLPAPGAVKAAPASEATPPQRDPAETSDAKTSAPDEAPADPAAAFIAGAHVPARAQAQGSEPKQQASEPSDDEDRAEASPALDRQAAAMTTTAPTLIATVKAQTSPAPDAPDGGREPPGAAPAEGPSSPERGTQVSEPRPDHLAASKSASPAEMPAMRDAVAPAPSGATPAAATQLAAMTPIAQKHDSQPRAERAGDKAAEVAPTNQVAAAQPVQATPAPAMQPHAASSVRAARHAPVAQDVGVEVGRAARGGHKEVSVRLDPAELGTVEVRWSTDEQGRVRTVIAADNPATLDLLKRDSHQLARALNDAGVQADASAFQFDLRREGQNNPRQPLPAAYSFAVASTAEDPAVPANYARSTGRAAPGRVDLLV